jgi:hypothetical protein
MGFHQVGVCTRSMARSRARSSEASLRPLASATDVHSPRPNQLYRS